MNAKQRTAPTSSTRFKQKLDRPKVLSQYRKYLNRGYAKLAEVMGLPIEASSDGAFVYDESGKEYLDFGGYGVFILGHRHPAVYAAVATQLEKHPLATRTFLSAPLGQAAESLVQAAPPGLERVAFVNSGAEAVELAIKIARLHGKTHLIAMENGFHGKTCGALSVTGRDGFRLPFRELLPNVQFIPYDDLDSLERTLRREHGNAAVIFEPVQGEGGCIIPHRNYVPGVRTLCDRHQAMMIADEIQTGLARLGHMWGVDETNTVPDLMLVGKGLSGGIVPVGAVLGKSQFFEPFDKDPLLHSSTFAGNPLAAAAAHAAVKAIREESIVMRSRKFGMLLLHQVRKMLMGHCNHLIREVRGKGLLIAIEFYEPHHAVDFMLRMVDYKVVLSHSLNQNRIIRLTPPAVITESEVGLFMHACWKAAINMKHTWKAA